jgi:hypothetical protein
MLKPSIRWRALFLSLVLSAVVKTLTNPVTDFKARRNVITRPSSEESSKATCTRIEKALHQSSVSTLRTGPTRALKYLLARWSLERPVMLPLL